MLMTPKSLRLHLTPNPQCPSAQRIISFYFLYGYKIHILPNSALGPKSCLNLVISLYSYNGFTLLIFLCEWFTLQNKLESPRRQDWSNMYIFNQLQNPTLPEGKNKRHLLNIGEWLKNFFFSWREGETEREERNIDMRERYRLVPSCMCPDRVWNWTCNSGPRPWMGLKPKTIQCVADALTTEPYWPGWLKCFKKSYVYLCYLLLTLSLNNQF